MGRHEQDSIESFIRQNRDRFEVNNLPEDHMEKFLTKLNQRIRHLINVLPYLIRVGIATILIFIASIIVWNNFIRKDRNEITLKHKLTHIVHNISRAI